MKIANHGGANLAMPWCPQLFNESCLLLWVPSLGLGCPIRAHALYRLGKTHVGSEEGPQHRSYVADYVCTLRPKRLDHLFKQN